MVADTVQEQFAEKIPETLVPHRIAFRGVTEKFRETGSVLNFERSGKPSKLNDKMLLNISDSILSKSFCKLAQKKNIGLALQQRIMRSDKNRTYFQTK
jgi:hypothetical protein